MGYSVMDYCEFLNVLCNRFPHLSVKGFKNLRSEATFSCSVCNSNVSVKPSLLLQRKSKTECCPFSTKEKLLYTLRERNIVPQTYTNMYTDAEFRCAVCKKRFTGAPRVVVKKAEPCPYCFPKEIKIAESRTKSHSEYATELHKKRNGQFRALETYVDANTPILHTCLTHRVSWKVRPAALINLNGGCPKCGEEKLRASWKRGCFRYKKVTLGGKVFHVQGFEDSALKYMVKRRGIDPCDIVVSSSGNVPTFKYQFEGTREYFPDMYIPRRRLIIEVKSTYTLFYGKKFAQNKMKAKAVMDAGFRYIMLLIDPKGRRIKLPKNWHEMSKRKVLDFCAL